MQRIYDTIKQYHMIEPGMQVIVGVSGGADSVCLLLALSEYRKQQNFSLTVVHVEHGIRGEESMEDEKYVAKLCREWDVPLYTEHVDAVRTAGERGISVEEAGRALRYEIFERTARRCKAQRIAVAHNQNDQAETVLWNLVRGSGIQGLGGIRPVRDRIIRPLLFLERREIEEILTRRKIAWRTDRTNLETDYTRNRIRLQVLPLLAEELNTQAVRHIAEAAGRLREIQEYLDVQTNRASRRCIAQTQGAIQLLLAPYEKEDRLIQKELLKECLRRLTKESGLRDVGAVHLEALERLCEQPCGKSCDLPHGIRAVRRNGEVRFCLKKETGNFTEECDGSGENGVSGKNTISRKNSIAKKDGLSEKSSHCSIVPMDRLIPEETGDPTLTRKESAVTGEAGNPAVNRKESAVTGEAGNPTLIRKAPQESGGLCVSLGNRTAHLRLLKSSDVSPAEIQKENQYTKWLSYDTITGNVCFRTRRSGDYLIVNESGGRRKLKDYMIDQKIPREERDRIWLLADGSHILWVIGWRISEAAKVRQDTKHILKIHIEEEPK